MFNDDKGLRTLFFLLACLALTLVVVMIEDKYLPAKLVLSGLVISGYVVCLWSYIDYIRSK